MKWEMEMEDVEAVLERIWDLHDKVSDAIHCISRAHFLHSIKIASPDGKRGPPPPGPPPCGDDARDGFVFVKELKEDDDIAVMAETKSLNTIRTALENLEDQLEYFHVSDAIHCISRAHFLHSIKIASPDGKHGPPPPGQPPCGDDARDGFVFVKEFKEDDDITVMAETKNLNTIRTALENLEDQLEYFHTVQSQQRAERDAATARLEQSRIILAMRLADHQGKKYKVIEEALDFVGDVHETGHFIAPENLYEMPRSHENSEDLDEKSPNIVVQMFISSLQLMKNYLKLERIGGVLGNAALFAVSMLALLQLHQVGLESETSQVQQQTFIRKKNEKNVFQAESSSQRVYLKHLDVFSARG